MRSIPSSLVLTAGCLIVYSISSAQAPVTTNGAATSSGNCTVAVSGNGNQITSSGCGKLSQQQLRAILKAIYEANNQLRQEIKEGFSQVNQRMDDLVGAFSVAKSPEDKSVLGKSISELISGTNSFLSSTILRSSVTIAPELDLPDITKSASSGATQPVKPAADFPSSPSQGSEAQQFVQSGTRSPNDTPTVGGEIVPAYNAGDVAATIQSPTSIKLADLPALTAEAGSNSLAGSGDALHASGLGLPLSPSANGPSDASARIIVTSSATPASLFAGSSTTGLGGTGGTFSTLGSDPLSTNLPAGSSVTGLGGIGTFSTLGTDPFSTNLPAASSATGLGGTGTFSELGTDPFSTNLSAVGSNPTGFVANSTNGSSSSNLGYSVYPSGQSGVIQLISPRLSGSMGKIGPAGSNEAVSTFTSVLMNPASQGSVGIGLDWASLPQLTDNGLSESVVRVIESPNSFQTQERTGFFMDERGLIVTAQLDEADAGPNVEVVCSDGKSYAAEVVSTGREPSWPALLRISRASRPLVLSTHSAKISERIRVLGVVGSLGTQISLGNVISGSDAPYFRVLALTARGFAGAPILNDANEVLGVVAREQNTNFGVLGVTIDSGYLEKFIDQKD